MDFDHKMTSNEWLNFNLQKKKDKVYELNRFYCYCGHSVVIRPTKIRTWCNYCGHWVYREKDKQEENIERIKMEEFRNKLKKEVVKLENTTN